MTKAEGSKTMVRQIVIVVTAFVILISTFSAHAQQTGKVWRVGFLAGSSADVYRVRLAAFRQGLKDLGYSQGKNLIIEERYGEGWRERIPSLAAELVRLNMDVIVTHGGRWAVVADRAAKKAGRTIPMVFAVDADPVGRGIVASLAIPGGNITGL